MQKPSLLAILACLACASSEHARPTSPTDPVTSAGAASAAAILGTSAVEKRVVISLGRKSGSSVLEARPDGTFSTTLDVLENGRGPHVDATFTLAEDGTPAAFDARGHHTMGTKFVATFRRDGDRARWKSDEEAGERTVAGSAFFIPLASVAEFDGLLVRAALKQGGRIPLLPAGEARVDKTIEIEISSGSTKRTVVGYAVNGLDLTPTYTWMNADGSWFGSVSDWYSVVPEGWEGAIAPLIAKQQELERTRDAKNFTTLAHRTPAAGLAYTHARVLDVERGRWTPDQTVIVVDGKIASVGPTRNAKVPAGAEVVDLTGRALIPGLWDMHAHFGDADGALNIASGVTTARDVGNDPDKLDDFKQRFDAGAAIGPHLYRFGFIEGRNEKAASSKVTAETPEEAKAAVKFFLDRKYDGIKIYNSVRPELVPILTAEAHAHGLRVTGHIPVHMLAHEAVRAGYDGIEHVNMLFLNFFATHETDTRDTTRFTLVGDKAADFDFNAEPAREFFALLTQHDTVIDPTLNAFEDLLVGEQGKVIPGLERLIERLPINVQRYFLLGGLPLGDRKERYRASYEKLLAMVNELHSKKIRLLVGTDSLAGLMLHHEMALFARAGVPNAAILKIATLDAAKSLGVDKQTGSIAPGKVADLVVLDGDPLARINDISRVTSTMRAGIVFGSTAVYETVGVRPLTEPAPQPSSGSLN
jgi:imidazolonepropionase-like amidohydrolase